MCISGLGRGSQVAGLQAQGRGPENFDGFPLAPDSGLTNADAVIERGDLDDFFQYGKAVNGKEE